MNGHQKRKRALWLSEDKDGYGKSIATEVAATLTGNGNPINIDTDKEEPKPDLAFYHAPDTEFAKEFTKCLEKSLAETLSHHSAEARKELEKDSNAKGIQRKMPLKQLLDVDVPAIGKLKEDSPTWFFW